jgi:uncharacterized protein YqfA (UPF0365 family)
MRREAGRRAATFGTRRRAKSAVRKQESGPDARRLETHLIRNCQAYCPNAESYAYETQNMPFAESLALLAAWTDPKLLIGFGTLGGIAFLFFAFLAQLYARIWLQAYWSGASVSLGTLIGMSFRQVDMQRIVQSKIVLAQAGIVGVDTRDLEAHFLAEGDLAGVVQAIVIASRSGISLDFDRAAAIDLAGRNALDAVQTSVSPRVIDCPDPKMTNKDSLSAVARDGVELRIQARVTVRTNIDFLIGGATESTIIARVGQGIISAVGSANQHTDVLSRPDAISKLLIEQGLDSNTAYQIVSIDIARIDIGDNIGARIKSDQADADMRVRQAESEARRANALARFEEMRALVGKRKAELILAESSVPKAIGSAFRTGKLGNCAALSLDLVGFNSISGSQPNLQ